MAGKPRRLAQTERYRNGIVDLCHKLLVNSAHLLFKTALIYGAYLFEKHNGVLCKAKGISAELNVSWKPGFVRSRGYCGGDDRWTVAIAGVILDYQYRTDSALLAADNGTQVGVIDISSFNACKQFYSLSDKIVLSVFYVTD